MVFTEESPAKNGEIAERLGPMDYDKIIKTLEDNLKRHLSNIVSKNYWLSSTAKRIESESQLPSPRFNSCGELQGTAPSMEVSVGAYCAVQQCIEDIKAIKEEEEAAIAEETRINKQYADNQWYSIRPSTALTHFNIVGTQTQARYQIKKGRVKINGELINSDELINSAGNYLINCNGINYGFSIIDN